MDLKVFFATFGAIFFAELADKTQLVGIGLSAKSAKPFSVWFGSVAAYIIVTALSVAIGALLNKYIKPEFIRYAGAAVFTIMGILMFAGKL